MVPVAPSRALVGDEGFGYDETGGLLWKKDGNGKFTLYQYDDLHRLIAVYYLPGALPNPISYEGLTAGVTYTYNGGISQRETMTDAAGTSAFEYDAQGRLSQYTPPLGLASGEYVEYGYNNAGQKTGVKIWNGTTASYDVSYEYYANGWLKAVKSGAQTIASYSYDANGALTAVKTADGQTEQQSFTYYPSGLMNAATLGTQTLMNLWDADEHRVQFSNGENNYTAVFDVTAGIPAVIKEVTPQGTVYYVREPGGELICRVVGESRWYYHFDELGSTRLITHDSGAVTDRYAYDAYGAVISHDRNTGTIAQPYQYVGQFGYYTHYDAPEFGWLQLGVRFYEPETGRFERRDPVVPDDSSQYAYASLAPLGAVDPSGMTAWPTCVQNGPKVRMDALTKAMKCLSSNRDSPKKLIKCMREKAASVSSDLLCSYMACAWYKENSSEGDLGGFRGYPCKHPWAKNKPTYCEGCAEWTKQKCDCLAFFKKSRDAALIKCHSDYNHAVIRCSYCDVVPLE